MSTGVHIMRGIVLPDYRFMSSCTPQMTVAGWSVILGYSFSPRLQVRINTANRHPPRLCLCFHKHSHKQAGHKAPSRRNIETGNIKTYNTGTCKYRNMQMPKHPNI